MTFRGKPALSLLAASAAMVLQGCGDASDKPEPPDLQTANTQSEREALASALPAGNFDSLRLGAKIAGPDGAEVESALSNEAGNFADMRSYVTCPEGISPCDPEAVQKGTMFTYVLVVTPGEDNDEDSGSGKGPDNSRVERATAFMMTKPAHGFTGKAGYSKAEAIAAMGKNADVVITCDKGKIVWTLSSGDGGDQWEFQEPITFYWQSTVPPAGPADAYEIHADYNAATGKGPYPAAGDPATNACA